jgi:YD repeat-containing protein
MRVSCNPDDRGYTRTWPRYDVYVNGVKERYAITADEELGTVTRYKRDAEGRIIHENHRAGIETVSEVKVEIVLRA